MENEKGKNKRPQVNALYCPEVVADAVNNHSWFADCMTGADKANKLLEALNFAEKWKGREEDLQNSDAQINSLHSEVENLREVNQALSARVAELESKLSEAQSQLTNGDKEKEVLVQTAQDNYLRVEQERDELQRKLDMITAEAGSKTGWDLVKACIDPAYAAVLEELTKRLVEKFNLDELEPQEVLISFFMQYYYNQEWEFSGMPFIMKQSEILEIVQGVYPDMTAKVLRQALQVKKK